MKNKRFLGQVLAVMLSVSMAAGVCAAEFGDGNDSSVFIDAAQETEVPEVTPGGTVTPLPEEMVTPEGTVTPTPGEAETPLPEATETPTPEITVTPGQEVTPSVTVTPSPSPSPEVTPVPSDDYEYTELEDGTISITSYSGDDSEIEIPSEINGKKVSRIGTAAFWGGRFYRAVIPDGVVEIEKEAFAYCVSVEEIIISDSVTKIGEAAFDSCVSLHDVKLPAKLEEIGGILFVACRELQNVTLSPENPFYTVADGALFNKDKSILLECLGDKGDYTIPESVKKIAPLAFTWNNIESVKITNTECEIAELEESNYHTLSGSVTIYGYPDSGAEAYANAHGNKFISLLDPTPTPDPEADYFCTDSIYEDGTVVIMKYRGTDSYVEIPSEIGGKPVSEIGVYAFSNNPSLKEVTIPDTVTEIQNEAFYNCPSLELVRIPASVEKIKEAVFGECSILNVEISEENPYYTVQDGALFSKDLKTLVACIGDKDSYTVPENVTAVGPESFYGLHVGIITIPNPECYIQDIGNQPVFTDVTAIRGHLGSNAHRYAVHYMERFIALEKVSVSSVTVNLEKTTYSYTGKALKPEVGVNHNGIDLELGTDYTVTYSKNTGIGTATVTIKGIGNYKETAKKTFQIVLGAPTVKAATSAGYNAAKITWNKVPGAKSYTLYYKGGTVKSWKAVATNLTKTSYTHKSNTKSPLTTGTQYTYTVKAVNGKNVSTYGKSTKTVKPVPAAVKLGKVTSVAYNKQKITWNKVAGATGYIVYQKINGSWKSIATTKALSYINTHKTEHPVVVGVTNTYTVRAYRKVGKSNIYGGYSKTGISGKALLAKPAVSKITKTSKGLKLEWKKVSGAVGYVVQRYDSGKWVTKKTINSSKTLTYTDTTAKKGKTYKYRIAAFCKVNGKPFYSVYSAVKSGKR